MSLSVLKSLRWCQLLAISAAPALAADPAIDASAESAVQIVQNVGPTNGIVYPPAPTPVPAQPMAPGAIGSPYPNAGVPYGAPNASNGFSNYSNGVSNYANGAAGYYGGGQYGPPGGYEARIGSPYHYFDPNGGQFMMTGNPYYDHFGPGYQRHSLYGHYRFPYYNYRAPWYYTGRAVYNRDTNFVW